MAYIQLTQGKVALVDDEDYEWLSKYKWQAHRRPRSTIPDRFEAVRNAPDSTGKIKTVRMHRLILDAPSGVEVDHINHNPLDNRRTNLRLCTRSQNMQNRKYPEKGLPRGVYLHKLTGKYVATIGVRRKYFHLGTFTNPEQAAAAYDAASARYHGEFGIRNS